MSTILILGNRLKIDFGCIATKRISVKTHENENESAEEIPEIASLDRLFLVLISKVETGSILSVFKALVHSLPPIMIPCISLARYGII